MNSSLRVLLCRGKEETRQWRGSEGEGGRSEVTLEFQRGEEKQKQGQEGEPRAVFVCQCCGGTFEYRSNAGIVIQ